MFPLFHPSLLSAAALLGMAGNFNQTGTDGQPCCGSPWGGPCGDGCKDEYTMSWTTQNGVTCNDHGDGTSTRVTWQINAGSGVCTRIYPDCVEWLGGGPVGYSYTCDYFSDSSDCSTTPATTSTFSGSMNMSYGFFKFGSDWSTTVYFFPTGCDQPVSVVTASGFGSGAGCPPTITLTNGFTIA